MVDNKPRSHSTNDLTFEVPQVSRYNRRNTCGSIPPAQHLGASPGKKLDVICEHALRTSSFCMIKHVPLRMVRFGHSTPCLCKDGAEQSDQSSNYQIPKNPTARESFLYKSDTSSSTNLDGNVLNCLSDPDGKRDNEDIIVTPFAQILSSLQKVRSNICNLGYHFAAAQLAKYDDTREKSDSSENYDLNLKMETLDALDWCLINLEGLETHQSIGTMANDKFKKMLNIELKNYTTDSDSRDQLSDYIFRTFFSQRSDLEDLESDQSEHTSSSVKNWEKVIADKETKPIEVQRLNEINIRQKILDTMYEWNFDMFELNDTSQGNSLFLIGLTIFENRNLLSAFNIQKQTMVNFLTKIQQSYRDMPYHNSVHASDVTQTANVMLECKSFYKLFTDLDIFAVIFACIIHDVDHPGVTNQYLINTCSKLAILYNDQSVLENHHLSTAFSILQEEQYDILSNLTKYERQTFRKLVIDIVLATDMTQHMTLLADLKTMVETKKVTVSGILNMGSYNNRKQVLQNLVHCADISNPTKPLSIYKMWIDKIMEEFFLQGDKEKNEGLEISPMCNRETTVVDKSQVGFIDFVVHPLWEAWCDLVFPDCNFPLENLISNKNYFSHKLFENEK